MINIDNNRPDQCRNFDYCSASLCPLDSEHLKIGIWYPDEEICRKKTVPDWVRRQKKIEKKTKDPNRYFTYAMLNHDCIIGKGMVGLCPDLPEEPQLKTWYKKHPLKKERTKKQLDIIHEARKRGSSIRIIV